MAAGEELTSVPLLKNCVSTEVVERYSRRLPGADVQVVVMKLFAPLGASDAPFNPGQVATGIFVVSGLAGLALSTGVHSVRC